MTDKQNERPPSREEAYEGRILGGKLRLDKVIGAGAMGEVYKAHHLGLDKVVAIKVLRQLSGVQAAESARFKAEARAASRIDHPNVVRILDFGEDGPDRLLYLAMEFLEGKSLFQLVGRTGALSEVHACWIMTQMLSALAAAHDQGVIHRDIKPGNVMMVPKLGDDGVVHDVVKVCDFGLAKLRNTDGSDYEGTSGPLTQKGAVFGTPAYMSPEQARGDTLDPRSDLYSCGVVFYRLVTGRAPFSSESFVGLLMKHINDSPPPPITIAPAISEAVNAVIEKSLAKNPNDRFQDARAMRNAVMACMAKLKGADQYKHVLTESVSNPTPVKLAEEAEALSYEDVELSEALMATHPAPMNELSVPSVALVSEHQATRIPIRLILGAIIGVSIGVILAMLYVGQPKPTKVEASDWKDTNTAIALNDIPPPAKPRKISPQSAVSSKPIAKVAPTAEVTQPSAPTVAAKSVESTARPQETNAQEKQPIVVAMQTSPKPAAKPPPRQKAKKSASRAANPREEPVARKSVVAVAPVNSPKESDSPSAAARAAPASPSPAAAEAAAARPAPAPAPLGPNSVFSFSMVGFQVEGGISKQKSRRTLLKKKREIETCFREVVLANNGPRTGAFMLKLTFGNRGRLRKISVDNKAEAAQSCIKAAIAPLRFPRADTGEAQVRVRVEYSVK